MKFVLFGCHVTVSPLFVGMLALLFFYDTASILIFTLLAMLWHELGHLVCMALCGTPPLQICLLPFEINLVQKQEASSSFRQAMIAAGGILFNLLGHALFANTPFGAANLFLALFHALPLISLDGYQLLYLALMKINKGKLLLFWVSLITLLMLTILGIYLLWRSHNPMLLLFCLYMGLLWWRKKP